MCPERTTDYLAGGVGLEPRNALGSKSARIAREFSADWAETAPVSGKARTLASCIEQEKCRQARSAYRVHRLRRRGATVPTRRNSDLWCESKEMHMKATISMPFATAISLALSRIAAPIHEIREQNRATFERFSAKGAHIPGDLAIVCLWSAA